jgi:hypothetical protein
MRFRHYKFIISFSKGFIPEERTHNWFMPVEKKIKNFYHFAHLATTGL